METNILNTLRLIELLKKKGFTVVIGTRSCERQHYENERKKQSHLIVETTGLNSLHYGLAEMLIDTEEDK